MSGHGREIRNRNAKEHWRVCRFATQALVAGSLVSYVGDLARSAPKQQTAMAGTEAIAVMENGTDYGQLG
jgi:hypothetical protein